MTWVEGPTLAIGGAIDLGALVRLRTGGGATVESRDGTIRVIPAAGGPPRVVGAGKALVATSGGRVIAALVPTPHGRPQPDQSARLVVYRLPN